MRLAFCCLMISNNTPDMFILDEPTNNLDIQSIEIITATIKNYTGTVIAISHDNYFIQEIGVEQCILLSQSIDILSDKSKYQSSFFITSQREDQELELK